MIQIGLLGAKGRMGQSVIQLLGTEFTKDAVLRVRVNRGDSISSLFDMDVVIDFSQPAAMQEVALAALNQKNALPGFVVGSTGWDSKGLTILEQLSRKTVVLQASNFSIGICLLSQILKQYGPLLKKFKYNPSISEVHHQHKRDMPSGTALSLQKVLSQDFGNSIQIHASRTGEVIGDHEITLQGTGEDIKIGHFAKDRTIFARGAIQTALWIGQRRKTEKSASGLVGMSDYFQSLSS